MTFNILCPEKLCERSGVRLRYSLFLNFVLHWLLVSFQHLGTAFRSRLQEWSIKKKCLWPTSCPETW